MTKLRLAALSILLVGTVSTLRADIQVQLQGDFLKTQAGAAAPQSSLFLLVASTANSTFSIANSIVGLSSTSIGSYLGGTDELVVARGDLGGFELDGVLQSTLFLDYTTLEFDNAFAPGQRLALLWFPSLTLNSTTLEAGARFGFYDGGTATTANATDADFSGKNGSSSWMSPAAGVTSLSLFFYTKDGSQLSPGATAANGAAAGNALGIVTVPEPTSLVLLSLLGLGGMTCGRLRGRPSLNCRRERK